MKPTDPLARLLRAAARDPGPALVPPTLALEQRVLRAWRPGESSGANRGEVSSVASTYHRGLAFAGACMVLALAFNWLQHKREQSPSPWTDPAAVVMLVYSR
jgi:hypothetical protein